MTTNRCLLKSSLIIFLLSAAPLIARASLIDTVTFTVPGGAAPGQFVGNVEANGLIQMSDLISFNLPINGTLFGGFPLANSITMNPAISTYTLSGFGTFNTLTDLWSPNGASSLGNNAWFSAGTSKAWQTAISAAYSPAWLAFNSFTINGIFPNFDLSFNTVECGPVGPACPPLIDSQVLQDSPTPQAPEFSAPPTAQAMAFLASCLLALWSGGRKAQSG